MKRVVLSLLASVSLTTAEVIRFELQDGLSPVKPPSEGGTSTGSGDAIESGIWFDDEAATLTFVMGYGSAAGFTDLTGPAEKAHIHNAAGVLFDLWGQHFMSSDPKRGGIIRGAVDYNNLPDEAATQAAVEELLAGKQYVNIHTLEYPAGEISGFLVQMANQAPSVTCPDDVTTECVSDLGTEVSLKALVSDPDGDALQVVWSVDGQEYQKQDVPAGIPGVITEVEFVAFYGVGSHTVTVTAYDAEGESSCQSMVTIEDTTPPYIKRVTTDRRVIWPPNHKMVPVRVKLRVEDCSPVTWRVVEVTSNEPVNGKGDGNTSPDWEISSDHKVHLRAERAGGGSGRVYTLRIIVTDEGGLTSEGTVDVKVPHNMGLR
jgi:hypothetical protein